MQNKVKKRRIKIEKDEYFISCPVCNKEIIGTTANQIIYNLKVHIERKHPEKIKQEKSK